jgi:16S rRNA (cytidine1402-2'-O)-methyltransferase
MLENLSVRPIVIYESPHRLQKTFAGIAKVFGNNKEIVVAKELTKVHEEIWHGSIESAIAYFVAEKGKGEFVIILP